jgi:hypothetical protein
MFLLAHRAGRKAATATDASPCTDCKHCVVITKDNDHSVMCSLSVNSVLGWMTHCAANRDWSGACGPEGIRFEAGPFREIDVSDHGYMWCHSWWEQPPPE